MPKLFESARITAKDETGIARVLASTKRGYELEEHPYGDLPGPSHIRRKAKAALKETRRQLNRR